MIKVKEADLILSLKVGDVVVAHDDGKQLSLEHRLRYLQRGYSRLIRSLRVLMREYAPLFANVKRVRTQILDTDLEKTGIGIKIYNDGTEITIEKIEELYLKATSTTDDRTAKTFISNDIQCTYISPDKYLSVKNNTNDMYDTTKNYFYTILSNEIYLLPILNGTLKYYQIELITLEDTATFGLEDTLLIPNEYIDLFITMAANEAMQDIGRADKVQLYLNDIIGQLTMLKGYADLKQQLKGSDING